MLVKRTKAQRIRVSDSNDIYNVMQQILRRKNKIDRDKEHFWTIGLNNLSTIQFIELVSIGNYNSTIVDPINVFRVAISKGALKIVLCHNHPCGQLIHSERDREVTNRLIQMGNLLGVNVMDHLVITPTSFFSFVDTGLYQELETSIGY